MYANNFEIQAFMRDITLASESDEALLRPRHADWRRNNLVAAMREAQLLFEGLPREAAEGSNDMANLLTHHRRTVGLPRMCQTLGRRTRYWLRRDAPPRELQLALDRARLVFEPLPDLIGLQLVRAWCNAWPTTRRFIGGPRGCRWRCFAVGGDGLLHYLSCPAMLGALAQCRHLRPAVWARSGDVRLAFNLLPLVPREVLNGAVWLYLYARVYHAARFAPGGRIGSPRELLRADRTAARSLIALCPAAHTHTHTHISPL